jgi:integrase
MWANGVLAAYTAWLRSWGASEETVKARESVARGRLREWGRDGFTVENAQTWLGRPNLARWSRATYHAHLSDFCAWLVATGRIEFNPMEEMRKPGRPQSLPRPLSEPEVARVLAAAHGRQRDWIMLALLSGLRAHEIAKLRGEDVTVDGIYVEGKGGTRASIPTHPDLWEIAQRYPRSGWWFPSAKVPGEHIAASTVSNYTGRFFRSLGISGSIHRCRHVYGTRLLRAKDTNIRTVQKLMRHANLDTTAAYTAVDEDELRSAIGRLSA